MATLAEGIQQDNSRRAERRRRGCRVDRAAVSCARHWTFDSQLKSNTPPMGLAACSDVPGRHDPSVSRSLPARLATWGVATVGGGSERSLSSFGVPIGSVAGYSRARRANADLRELRDFAGRDAGC